MDYDFMMYYMQLPSHMRVTIGHQFKDFIKGCTFRQKDCLEERYKSINTHLFYNHHNKYIR